MTKILWRDILIRSSLPSLEFTWVLCIGVLVYDPLNDAFSDHCCYNQCLFYFFEFVGYHVRFECFSFVNPMLGIPPFDILLGIYWSTSEMHKH